MPTRAQKIRLAVFLIVGTLALLILIATITSQKLFKKRDIYYIAYENVSVSGLEVGSPVKYLGIKVGTIEDIRIDPKNVNRVIVKVALEPGTPIKTDARADIASIGITGLKMIEIRGGSNEAPLLKVGGYIQPGSSITEEITGKAEVIAEKLEKVLNNLQDFTAPENLQKFTQLAENANASFDRINRILDENRLALNQSIHQARRITARLDSASELFRASMERFQQIMVSDTLEDILAGARDISLKLKEANLVQLIEELGEVVNRTNRLLLLIDQNVERSSADFQTSVQTLKISLQYLNEAVRMIQQDPSVLIRGTKYENVPDERLEQP